MWTVPRWKLLDCGGATRTMKYVAEHDMLVGRITGSLLADTEHIHYDCLLDLDGFIRLLMWAITLDLAT